MSEKSETERAQREYNNRSRRDLRTELEDARRCISSLERQDRSDWSEGSWDRLEKLREDARELERLISISATP